MHHTPKAGVRRLVRYVLGFTLASEAAGAFLLWLRFRSQFPAGEAAWQSVFHAVSAFCNAGFGLLPDNLVRYRGDLLVNLAITGLIVLGGLGFLVNMELRDQAVLRLRGRRAPHLTLHARLALVVTAALLAGGMVVFLVLEWDNVLRGLPLGERALAAWFQSVTPRTAGFNTIDYGQVVVRHAVLHDLPDVRGGLAGLDRGRHQDHDLRAAGGARRRALARTRPGDPLPPDDPPRGHGPGAPPHPPRLGAGVPGGGAPGAHRDAWRAARRGRAPLRGPDVRGGLRLRHRGPLHRHHPLAERCWASWCSSWSCTRAGWVRSPWSSPWAPGRSGAASATRKRTSWSVRSRSRHGTLRRDRPREVRGHRRSQPARARARGRRHRPGPQPRPGRPGLVHPGDRGQLHRPGHPAGPRPPGRRRGGRVPGRADGREHPRHLVPQGARHPGDRGEGGLRGPRQDPAPHRGHRDRPPRARHRATRGARARPALDRRVPSPRRRLQPRGGPHPGGVRGEDPRRARDPQALPGAGGGDQAGGRPHHRHRGRRAAASPGTCWSWSGRDDDLDKVGRLAG